MKIEDLITGAALVAIGYLAYSDYVMLRAQRIQSVAPGVPAVSPVAVAPPVQVIQVPYDNSGYATPYYIPSYPIVVGSGGGGGGRRPRRFPAPVRPSGPTPRPIGQPTPPQGRVGGGFARAPGVSLRVLARV